MAGQTYSVEEIDRELDLLIPEYNKDKELPVTKELVKAFAMAENSADGVNANFKNALSSANAMGVMQVIPPTLAGLKKKGYLPANFSENLNASSLSDQLRAGVATIRELIDTRKTNNPLKLAAYYNGGNAPGNYYAETGKTDRFSEETRGYLQKVKNAFEALGAQITDGITPPTAGTVQPSAAFKNSPLDAARQAQAGYMELVPQLMDALFGANQQVQQSGQVQQQSITAAAEAAATAARTQAEITIGEQQVHSQIMNALGLDVRDPNSAISKELQAAAATRAQREQLRGKITELQSKSLFTDPIGYILAIPEIGQLVPQHNQLVDLENDANAQIARMQQIANNVKSLTPAKNADLLRAKAAADANQVLSQAQANAAQVSAQNAAGNAKLMLDQFTLKRNIFSDILQMEGRDAQLELANQNRQDRKERALDKAAADREKAEEKRRETAFVQGVNLFRRAIAGNVPDYEIADIKTMPAELRTMWYDVVTRGSFGNSYAQAIPFINRFGNISNAAQTGNAAMMQLVRNVEMQARRLAPEIMAEVKKTTGFMGKVSDDDALQMAYDRLYQKTAGYAAKGFDKSMMSSSDVPYVPDYDAFLAANKDNTTNVVATILRDAKERARGGELRGRVTDGMIVSAVMAEVNAGKIAPAKAAEQLSSFYKTMTSNQYQSAGLKYLGLPPLVDYQIKPGSMGDRKVDLFNTAQVENYLTAEVAAKRRRESTMRAASGPTAGGNVFFPFGVENPFGQ